MFASENVKHLVVEMRWLSDKGRILDTHLTWTLTGLAPGLNKQWVFRKLI